MKQDKFDSFLFDNAELLFDEPKCASTNHRDKFALKLGAASVPKWSALRLERLLCAAVLLIGVFLVVNHKTPNIAADEDICDYAQVASYYVNGVNARIDSLLKKTESLDSESRALIVNDLIQMKEENNNLMRKNPKYNVSVFEAALMDISTRQNEALNSLEQNLAKNN